MTDATDRRDQARMLSPGKVRRFERLQDGPWFEQVVDLAAAYVRGALPDARASEGVTWALSCLPGTTPRRLSALTMRITDILVVNRPAQPAEGDVDALVIVSRSEIEAAFPGEAAEQTYPSLVFRASEYHGAGPDQMMIRGAGPDLARCLRDPRVAAAARTLAADVMREGRVMHWRGHNALLVDEAIA